MVCFSNGNIHVSFHEKFIEVGKNYVHAGGNILKN